MVYLEGTGKLLYLDAVHGVYGWKENSPYINGNMEKNIGGIKENGIYKGGEMQKISDHDAEILRTEFYWPEERFKKCPCDKVCEWKNNKYSITTTCRIIKLTSPDLDECIFCPWCGGKIKEV